VLGSRADQSLGVAIHVTHLCTENVIMTDKLGVTTAHLTEIGKLTVLTAQIEYHLAGITAMLISPTVSEVDYKVVGKQHFAALAKRVLPEQLGLIAMRADALGSLRIERA
jgi:hypothetical protein